jgi:hypothetical protein
MTQYFARIQDGAVYGPLFEIPDGAKIQNCIHADFLSDMKPCSADIKEGQIFNDDGTFGPVPPLPPAPPRTVFSPREVIETLFTAAEQQAIFSGGWQMAKFVALISGSPSVDVTSAEFVADIGMLQAANVLTSDRANKFWLVCLLKLKDFFHIALSNWIGISIRTPDICTVSVRNFAHSKFVYFVIY